MALAQVPVRHWLGRVRWALHGHARGGRKRVPEGFSLLVHMPRVPGAGQGSSGTGLWLSNRSAEARPLRSPILYDKLYKHEPGILQDSGARTGLGSGKLGPAPAVSRRKAGRERASPGRIIAAFALTDVVNDSIVLLRVVIVHSLSPSQVPALHALVDLALRSGTDSRAQARWILRSRETKSKMF